MPKELFIVLSRENLGYLYLAQFLLKWLAVLNVPILSQGQCNNFLLTFVIVKKYLQPFLNANRLFDENIIIKSSLFEFGEHLFHMDWSQLFH